MKYYVIVEIDEYSDKACLIPKTEHDAIMYYLSREAAEEAWLFYLNHNGCFWDNKFFI